MSARIWTEEQLSAFIDNELSDADAHELANDLVEDARLHARYEKLCSANAAILVSVAEINDRPLTSGVRAALSSANAARAAGQGAETVAVFRPRRLGDRAMKHRGLVAGLAAAGAMFAVTTAVQPAMFAVTTPAAGEMIARNSAFERVLQTAPSARSVRLSAALSATPRISFTRDDGSFCRQYDAQADDQHSSAIACLEQGGWRVMVAAATPAPTQADDYFTASASKSSLLESFLDTEMAGAPLDADAEASMIRRAWKR